MSAGEVTDVFNEDGDLIGSMSREQAEQDNHIIQNVIVFVFNALGKVWVQKRPMSKKHYPGLWDVSACGALHSGEEPLAAAKREQMEEMGFVSDLKEVETFINVFPDETGDTMRTRLSHLYIGVSEEIPRLSDEVDEFRSVPFDELRRSVAENPEEYIPSFLLELNKAIAAFSTAAF